MEQGIVREIIRKCRQRDFGAGNGKSKENQNKYFRVAFGCN